MNIKRGIKHSILDYTVKIIYVMKYGCKTVKIDALMSKQVCQASKKATRVAWHRERLSQNNRWKTVKTLDGTVKK